MQCVRRAPRCRGMEAALFGTLARGHLEVPPGFVCRMLVTPVRGLRPYSAETPRLYCMYSSCPRRYRGNRCCGGVSRLMRSSWMHGCTLFTPIWLIALTLRLLQTVLGQGVCHTVDKPSVLVFVAQPLSSVTVPNVTTSVFYLRTIHSQPLNSE